jgi:NADH-quinone oxidoreductase subunit K
MQGDAMGMFWQLVLFVIILFSIGVYCLLFSFNLIRALIGVEIMIKAATLLIIAVGQATGHAALTQAMVITLIVIEAVVMTVAIGVVLGIHRHTNALDIRKMRKT